MIRRLAVAGAFALAVVAAPAWAGASVSVGTRGATISTAGPIGESFVADGAMLTSFGFQFGVGNATLPNSDVTFELLSGVGLTGSVIATRTATLSVPTGRTPTWYDFDLTGTTLTVGQSYTALVSTASARLALFFGPALSSANVPATGDAYLPGRLVSTGYVDAASAAGYCATSGACDANFRFTTLAAAAVPEMTTWVAMLVGMGAIGGTLRRRRGAARAQRSAAPDARQPRLCGHCRTKVARAGEG